MSDAPTAQTPLGDLLQQLAPRLAVDAQSPLVALGELTLPAAAPQATPLAAEAAVAWRAMLGEIGLAWQFEALTTVRRGGGIALVAPVPLGPAALLLLIADQLATLDGTLLLLAADQAALAELATTVGSLDALLGGALPHLVVEPATRPPHRAPALLMMTVETLHQRVLRLHDRRWSALWPRLAGVVVPALDRLPGAVLGHLRWLLRRVARMRPSPRPPLLYVSIAPVADPEETLALMLDALPPLVTVSTSRTPLTWAMWRGGADPVQTTLDLALALRSAGISIHLGYRTALERAILARRAAQAGLPLMSLASPPAHALLLPGGFDAATLPELASSGYRAVILIGDASAATAAALEQPALATPNAPVTLPMSAANSYVDSAHIRCAAEECPLTAAEIAAWGSAELVERLERKHLLSLLPGTLDEWQPVAGEAGDQDAYTLLHPASAGGGMVRVEDESGQLLAHLDAAAAERGLFPGAELPGATVERWADDVTVVLRLASARPTRAEHRVTVQIRETFAQRSLDGGRADVPLHAGRVLVREQIVARRELHPDGTVRRMPFDPPLDLQWSAPAVWVAAPAAPHELGEILAGVLPLLVRCLPGELVPCVHNDTLFLVESQPGGRGLVDHVYSQFEALLHVATLARQAVRTQRLLRPAAQAEVAWLETLLMPLALPDQPPQISPLEQPAERRSPQTLGASPQEVAARHQILGRSRPRAELRARTRSVTPAEPPPPPVVPAAVSATPPPARDGSSRPTGRRRSQDFTRRPSRTAPEPTVLPTRREPPPFERPPFQERRPTRSAAPEPVPPPATRSAVPEPVPPPATRSAVPEPVPPPATRSAAPAQVPSPDVPQRRPTPSEPAPPRPAGLASNDVAPFLRDPGGRKPSDTRPLPRSQPRDEPMRPLASAQAEPVPPDLRNPARPIRRDAPPAPPDSVSRPARRVARTEPPGAGAQAWPARPPEPDDLLRRDPPESGRSRSGRDAARDDPQSHLAAPTELQPAPPERRPGRNERAGGNAPSERGSQRSEPASRPPKRSPDSHDSRGTERAANPLQRSDARPAPERGRQRDEPASRPTRSDAPPERGRQRDEPASRPTRSDAPPERGRQRDEPASRPTRSDAPPERGRQRDTRDAGRAANPPRRSDARPAPEPVEMSSDPAALLAKARRLREQREAEIQRQAPPPRPQARPTVDEEPAESRFSPGDRVFCVPYGEGIVQKARIRDGRELLLVQFAELGELRIDPMMNAVRLITTASAEEPEEPHE